LKTLFREENLGCGLAVSGAISWFFEKVESGVILEDDIVPSSHFFNLSEQILEEYRDNKNVMHFGGVNFLESNSHIANFYFSKICHVWGWATWRDRWIKYNINFFEGRSDHDFDQLFKRLNFNSSEKKFWNGIRLEVQNHQVDTWDYSWQFSIWLNDGISITPVKNLVKNIGSGLDATHTATVPTLNLPTEQYSLRGECPQNIKVDRSKDSKMMRFIRGEDVNKVAFLKRVIKGVGRRLTKNS
jgi:GR25 family glycosyltransferase involved in LPS biosynthesis